MRAISLSHIPLSLSTHTHNEGNATLDKDNVTVSFYLHVASLTGSCYNARADDLYSVDTRLELRDFVQKQVLKEEHSPCNTSCNIHDENNYDTGLAEPRLGDGISIAIFVFNPTISVLVLFFSLFPVYSILFFILLVFVLLIHRT